MIAFTDLTKLYGLEQYHTGGGCTALTAAWETGHFYWLITISDDASIPKSDDEPVTVGLYDDASGDCIAVWEFDSTTEAVLFMRRTKFW